MKLSVLEGQIICCGQVLNASTIYSLVFCGEKWEGPSGTITGADLVSTGLNFSEYPCTPGLHLQSRVELGELEIFVGLMGKDNDKFYPVSQPADYVIAEKSWIPLPNGTESAMAELLQNIGLTLGSVSIGQYLRLQHSSLAVPIWDEAANSLASEQLSTHLSVAAPDGLQARFYPYQENGYRWLDFMARHGVGAILADEMGLGKTLQVIAVILAETHRSTAPNLVVCPATLLENWRRECAKFAPSLRVLIHSGRQRTGASSELLSFNVVVCSYETMTGDISMLRDVPWNLVVIDEAQAVKNPEAQRTLKIKRLPRKAAIAITGTPVENSLRDVWSIADFVAPRQLGDFKEFERRFLDTEDHAKQLEPLISSMMLRRRVRDVAKDLPDRIEIPVALELDEPLARAYEELRVEAARRNPQAADFTAMVPLRMYCAHPWAAKKLLNETPFLASPKLTRLFGILEEVILNGEKALVFTSFQAVADLITRLVREEWEIFAAVIDGRVPVSERQGLVDALGAASPSGVLVLNPKAAGVGLNITSANHVIHYNLEWNPAVEDQASARSYRRGQERPVTVHRLFYSGTVEEIIDERMQRKRNLSNAAVIGTDGASVDVEDLNRALTISPVRK